MKKIKSFLFIFLAILLFSSGAVAGGVYAIKKITAVYNGLNIYVNEKLLKDTEAFIYREKGITMVSLRDIGEALGLNVHWEEKTNSIFLSTSKEAKPSSNYFAPEYKYWDERNPKIDIENIRVLRNVGFFYKKEEKIMIAGRPFYSGIVVTVDEDNKKAEVVLDLYKKFSTISGYLGVEDETRNSSGSCQVKFLADGEEVYQSDILKPAKYPIYLPPGKVNLVNANQLKIVVTWMDTEDPGDYSKVMAALANFKLYKV